MAARTNEFLLLAAVLLFMLCLRLASYSRHMRPVIIIIARIIYFFIRLLAIDITP